MTKPHILAWLGGGQRHILREAPGDATKLASMGAVLVGTAAVASASAAFALTTAVGLTTPAAVVVGILWGLLILALDRMLVISMSRRTGFWPNVAAAAPRLVLALLIGAVISVPLVLRIFQPEINSELQVMRSESLIANQKKLDEQFADLPTLQARVDELQAVADGREQPNVSSDPDVRTARDAVTTAQKSYDDAAAKAQCELDGRCGTGRAGQGDAWRSAQTTADRALATLNAAKAELAAVETAVRDRISGGAAAAASSARAELTTLRPTLDERVAARAQVLRDMEKGEKENTGLLSRLEALDRLSDGRPMMFLAHWALILLFACIELLPVIAKLFSSSGPPTLYEQLVQVQENGALAASQVRSDRERELAELEIDVRTEIERHRAAIQVEAGKHANARLLSKQQELADRAIDVWAEVAKQRTDEELARWYAWHARNDQSPVASTNGSQLPASPPTAGS
ncbi:DUF4407 domain-containing protein [Asanoa siamensis]|uniref:DUF4407 domain-containing protein n=1 Tax=Asanoa siamensis TaxID=926357 RepID=A0ABQ4CRJ9_9ACTN|nr:DUF4407 domain-containing protein [Asanoa siamensis]GIF73923.1 hypothetical protein Asi02nite_34410 [Asanoa siamensis]